MTESAKHPQGGCLCGAVRYEVRGPLRDVVTCHCSMCHKLHGGSGPHSKAAREDIVLLEDRGLRWYESSTRARRGFCAVCGSGLFWEPVNQPGTGIVAGTLDQPTGLKTIGHIFVAERCDFTEIAGEAPRFEGSSEGALEGDAL